MNDITQPQTQGNQDGLTNRPGLGQQPDRSIGDLSKQPYRHFPRLLQVIGSALALVLGFVYTPHVCSMPIYSQGWVWDYPPCDTTCPCPPSSHPFGEDSSVSSAFVEKPGPSCGVVCAPHNRGAGRPAPPGNTIHPDA